MLKLLSKLTAISLFFIVPSIILINRYATERTVEVKSTIGLVPTIFIFTIILVALWFTTNQLSEMIRQSKFGWLAILFFGLTLGILLAGMWFVVNSVLISINTSVDEYVLSMEYHKTTLYYMLYSIGSGIGIGFIAVIWQLDLTQKIIKKNI